MDRRMSRGTLMLLTMSGLVGPSEATEETQEPETPTEPTIDLNVRPEPQETHPWPTRRGRRRRR